jgi:tRNA modification GTPase
VFDDTIAAIATPLGEGGLAVIRVSGPAALAVAEKVFRPAGKQAIGPVDAPSHTIHFGRVFLRGQVVDEVLLAVMRAPRTFTREHVVEITCHGGLLPARLVLEAVLESGARPAEPGEFTRRAFLNGRIDLAQAEAVIDLIHARTELALSAAQEQLAGKLSRRIHQLRDELMQTLAHVEAHIDFPDEDIAPDTREQLLARLERGVDVLDGLLRTAHEGRILRHGIRAAIIGRPNVGKSSLLNQLLGHDRAIVSPIPGTTRDTIEETANIRGLPVVFIDTAGLRESGDVIEVEGVRRSRETLGRAELILHVLDSAEPLTAEDRKFLAEAGGKQRILVVNKVDLPRRWEPGEITDTRPASAAPMDAGSVLPSLASVDGEGRPPGRHWAVVEVSCVTGAGLEPLKDAIREMIWSGGIKAEMLEVMINARHQEALQRAREAILRALDGLRADLTLDLVAMELHIGVNAIGEIVGLTSTEDLLDSIFSQFCIGK